MVNQTESSHSGNEINAANNIAAILSDLEAPIKNGVTMNDMRNSTCQWTERLVNLEENIYNWCEIPVKWVKEAGRYVLGGLYTVWYGAKEAGIFVLEKYSVPATEEGRVQLLDSYLNMGFGVCGNAIAVSYLMKKEPMPTVPMPAVPMEIIFCEALVLTLAGRFLPATANVAKVVTLLRDVLIITVIGAGIAWFFLQKMNR